MRAGVVWQPGRWFLRKRSFDGYDNEAYSVITIFPEFRTFVPNSGKALSFLSGRKASAIIRRAERSTAIRHTGFSTATLSSDGAGIGAVCFPAAEKGLKEQGYLQ